MIALFCCVLCAQVVEKMTSHVGDQEWRISCVLSITCKLLPRTFDGLALPWTSHPSQRWLCRSVSTDSCYWDFCWGQRNRWLSSLINWKQLKKKCEFSNFSLDVASFLCHNNVAFCRSVAQVARVLPWHGRGQQFKSARSYQIVSNMGLYVLPVALSSMLTTMRHWISWRSGRPWSGSSVPLLIGIPRLKAREDVNPW